MKSKNSIILSTSPPAQTAEKPKGTVSLIHGRRFLYGGRRRNFTGKERDSETGLYYFGARYLDPRASRWLSGDPALGEYVPEAPVSEEARKRNGSLPGMGGVFNYVNLHAYHYAGNNPVKYMDPDGKSNTATIAVSFSWLPLVDSPVLPFGDIAYLVIIGVSAIIEYGIPLINAAQSFAPQIPALIDNLKNTISAGSGSPDGWRPDRFKESLERLKARITNSLHALDQRHLDDARNESLGKVKKWPSGKEMDHGTEVRNALDTVKNLRNTITGALENPNVPQNVRKEATELLENITEYIESVEKYIGGN